MRKILFFDYDSIALAKGFSKTPHSPQKSLHNPLFIADKPWEFSNFTMYGTAVYNKSEGLFKLWYTSVDSPWALRLYYAESCDGLCFVRPELPVHQHHGRWTNRVHPEDLHGAAILLDEADGNPDRRYKMLAGIGSGPIQAFFSADGKNWQTPFPYPAIPSKPDCPMGLCRLQDGRYLATYRLRGEGRRTYMSESWDFVFWSEPRLIYESDASDPPGTQVYGFGVAPYGGYLLGTPWLYHMDADDWRTMNGWQETELAYARNQTCWHRLVPGRPFLQGAVTGTWESGNLQMSSMPIYLENEIRYYYAATNRRHSKHWELEPQSAGLGMAILRPDGFVSLDAGETEAFFQTRAIRLSSGTLRLNAVTGADGYVAVSILDTDRKPLPGVQELPVFSGDSINHVIRLGFVPEEPVIVMLRAKNASVYAVAFDDMQDECSPYYQFSLIKGVRTGL